MNAAVTLFTDPACPFAFSAEPVRWALKWRYGDQLSWSVRMIGLTLEDGEAEKLAGGAAGLQKAHGMPIDPAPYPRASSSLPACRAVVAARLRAPAAAEALLRAQRVRRMAGGLLDADELLDGAAQDAGLDPAELRGWTSEDDVEAAFQGDLAAARDPSPAARRLDHKLGGPTAERRYSAPSYELTAEGGRTFALPGFNPIEAYEAALGNFGLTRRAPTEDVTELLSWAGTPLATAELVALSGLDDPAARARLVRAGAEYLPAGADGYWRIPPAR